MMNSERFLSALSALFVLATLSACGGGGGGGGGGGSSPPAGSLDSRFGTNGIVTTAIGTINDFAHAIALQSDGKIVVAGSSYNGTNYDFALVRYNTNGSLDTSFDTDGKVTTAVGTSNAYARAIALQSDGKIVVAGVSFNGTKDDIALLRYNTNGSLDTSFDTDGIVTTAVDIHGDSAYAIALQSDGKIVVAGSSHNGINSDIALLRYNTNGSLDTSFDTDGKVTTAVGTSHDFARAIALQSDGKIVVAGSSSNGTNDDFALLRYNTNGSLDTSFDTDGIVTTAVGTSNDYAYAIALQSDGKIVAAGNSFTGTNYDFALARYNTNGSLDTSFGTGGIVTTPVGTSAEVANAIALQSDGKIMVAGTSSNGTNDDFALLRYNTNGSLDPSFDTDGIVTTAVGTSNDYAYAIALQSDGKIVAAGIKFNDNGNDDYDIALARYNP